MFGRTPLSQDPAPEGVSEPLFRNAGAGGLGLRPPVERPVAATPAPRAPQPASAPRTVGSVSSLSSVFRLEGDLTGEADLQLDGQVKGDLRVHRLVIGPTARVEGAVRAHSVEVHGHVLGTIEAEVVRLHATAEVTGDISPGQLSIENGARFEGRVQPLSRPARAAAPEAAAPQPATASPFGEAPRLRAVEPPASSHGSTAA